MLQGQYFTKGVKMMIEEIIKNHLVGKLDVDVVLEHESKTPASFVLIEKTGSFNKNGLGGSLFIVQSYAKSLYEAAKLNDRVKIAMKELINLSEIVSVKLNSDYNYTDTQTKRYRYQAVYDIKHY